MKTLWHGTLSALICFLIILPYSGYAAENTFTLRFSNFFPAPHSHSIVAEQWCREVEKETNGRVKINYFPGGTLTPAGQTYDSVVKGIADVGESLTAYTRGRFPLTEVIDLPLGLRSGYQATKMVNEYYARFKPKELDAVKVMYFHCYPPAMLFLKRPVYKMEDLKGMKIRCHGLSAKVVQALGGAPVGMSMNETYDALSRGVAEGVVCPFEAMKGWRLAEVVEYVVENYGSSQSAAIFVVMNKSKWQSLPPDIQRIIERINASWIEKEGKTWDEGDKIGRQLMMQMGRKFISLSKEEDARWARQVEPVIADYVKTVKAKGLPAEEALKFCRDYIQAHPK